MLTSSVWMLCTVEVVVWTQVSLLLCKREQTTPPTRRLNPQVQTTPLHVIVVIANDPL